MMLQIKHAPNDVQSMSQDGTAILRSLQNKSLPVIDLMVRESLQNSLDAAREGLEKVNVQFTIGQFESADFARNLEEVSEKITSKYPSEQTFIAVSDKNTYGLTGDYLTEERELLDKSNFQKLVFGIGKNQEKDGAGGSWGLGKTSYFRLGGGIVIYYTRIINNGNYEERLIASIIESPKEKERLLLNNDRGIAWWGEFGEQSNKILPLVNGDKIEKILSIFNLARYQEDETGTTIIIPYINEINQAHEKNLPWQGNLEEEVNMAVQRWYFPRIQNKSYTSKMSNSYLEVKVNDTFIHPELNMEPVFKLYQSIYTAALLGESVSEDIIVKPIFLGKNALENSKEPIGFIAFKEVSKEELKMTPPENKVSGLTYLGVKDADSAVKDINKNHNSKVIAYCRKPGMVVEYAVDSQWSPAEQLQNNDNLLFGFFVPISNAKLEKIQLSKEYKDIEEYLRATEQSDHATWKDEDNITIVSRIQKYCSKAIKDHYHLEEANEASTVTSALSRKFGSLLMPPTNFGKTSKREKPTGGGVGGNKNRNADIALIDSDFIDVNKVKVSIKLFLKGNISCEVYLQVLSQDKRIDIVNWNKSMQGLIEFPFAIEDIQLDSNNHIQLTKIKDDTSKFIVTVSNDVDNFEVEGYIILNVKSNDYIPNIAIKTVEAE